MEATKRAYQEACSCGHDHHEHGVHNHEEHRHEACGCGHDHGHEEHHHETCGCSHDHGHGGHRHEACGCDHDHEHEEHHHDHSENWEGHSEAADELAHVDSMVNRKVYILDNLGCANCASKMEKKIRELDTVQGATITFATKQLCIAADHPERLYDKIQEICSSIESEVVVREKNEDAAAARAERSKNVFAENKTGIITVAAGACLFAAGEVIKGSSVMASDIMFVLAYLILGREILLKAGKGILKGKAFDENFLMSVATLAAFAIGDFAEAVGVMLFYRVGELFEDIAVERSRNQIMDAVDLRPEVVNIVKGSEVTTQPAEKAKTGDILLVRPGDRIPLDGVVVEGESRIDTSPVTGEPVPVKAEKGSEVISGCVNTSGLLKIRVEKELKDSMVTRILDSVENAAASKPKLDRFITRFARIYTPIVVLLAIGTAVIPSLLTGDWNHWIYTAITFLVISCPCALVLSVPLAFFSGIGAGSKKGILFKGGVSLEALKDVKAIVMDKTGTITKGNFVVTKCVPENVTEETLLLTAAECEMTSTHPIANSIVNAAREKGLELKRPEDVKEIAGKGVCAQTEQGEVLCGNRGLMEMYHVDLPACPKGGYGTEVLTALNGKYIGRLLIADTIKDDSVSAIAELKRNGIVTAMLTGDAMESAQSVAKEAGIDEVHAQLLPEEKLSKLQTIRKNYGTVMFVGDGINDAPVLAGADVGAAMGSGADAAIEAADVVFMTSAMQAVPDAVAIAKATGKIAVQNVVFALAIKALVMILGFCGLANMWLAVFADTGVAMLCVLNSIRVLYRK